jgi:hypothetical protein
MAAVFRAYLRTFDGKVDATSKTITADRVAADAAFSDLVNKSELDGQKFAAVLSYNNAHLAFHRFDRNPGDADYWRDKLDEIQWPGGHGGARDGAGRSAQTTDGGPLERKTVTVDKTTITTLTAYGDGEFSEGIRRAARAVSSHTEE